MSVKNHTDLDAQVAVLFPDNSTQFITAEKVRMHLLDLDASAVNMLGDVGILGLLGYSTLLTISNPGHITHKSYVDTADLLLLPLDGSRSMTGDLKVTTGVKIKNASNANNYLLLGATGVSLNSNSDVDITTTGNLALTGLAINIFSPTNHAQNVTFSDAKGIYWASGTNIVDNGGYLTLTTTSGSAIDLFSDNSISLNSSNGASIDLNSNDAVNLTGLNGITLVPGAGKRTLAYTAFGLNYATISTVPYIDASKNLVSSAVTPTELGYVSGVTSAIQTQLNTKAATSGTLAQFAATTSLELKGVISDETGSGSLVFATSPTLVTPVLGAATATSINGNTITTGTGTLTLSTFTLTVSGTASISGTHTGTSSGTNTGDQTTVSGNAGTATALQNARTIGGISFDGTANIVPQTIQSVNEATDTTCFPLFISASGSQSLQPLNNAGFIYNSNTNALTATTFIGALTGNASTVTTNANLTGAITSTGNATILGSFNSANLLAALTDPTGTGVNVFGTSPAITTSITTASTTFALINTTATTVSFAGGASTALNMGHASGTNTFLGATTFSQQQSLSAGVLSNDGTVSLPAYSFTLDTDCGLYRVGTNSMGLATAGTLRLGITSSFINVINVDLEISTLGRGLYIKEGANATMGTATLSSGSVVVSTTKVTASSRIYITVNGGTLTNVGSTYVSARTAGTSFTISSTNVLDSSSVAWIIIEPL